MLIWLDGEGTTGGEGATGTEGGQQTGQQQGQQVDLSKVDLRSMLPEDLRSHASLEKFSKAQGKEFLEAIVRSNISAQSMIGANPEELVKVPTDPTKITAEDRKKFLQRVGLPVKEEAYALKPMKEAVKGFGHDEPLAKWFSSEAAKLGMFPDQAQAVYEGFVGQLQMAMQARTNELNAADKANIDGLQKEYGTQFDGEVKAARFGVQQIGGKELADRLTEVGLGTDPVLFKAFAKIGRLFAENASAGDKPNFETGKAPGAIKAEADALLRQAVQIMDTNPREAKRLNEEAQKILAGA
jgi:hypothetical protein